VSLPGLLDAPSPAGLVLPGELPVLLVPRWRSGAAPGGVPCACGSASAPFRMGPARAAPGSPGLPGSVAAGRGASRRRRPARRACATAASSSASLCTQAAADGGGPAGAGAAPA